MKKKGIVWIILATVLLLAILFIPVPNGVSRDGGTRVYSALTYKVVDWNRITEGDRYSPVKVYWFPENFKSLDELWAVEEQTMVHKIVATVVELKGSTALVTPAVGEDVIFCGSMISFSTAELGDIGAQVGSCVEVWYEGPIMETYPSQIHAVKWEIAKDLRHRKYDRLWLDPETANDSVVHTYPDLVILEIYSDCFFATPAIPMPYTIKLNGALSAEWCVGDLVRCTYENTRYDERLGRMEADLLTVTASDWQPTPGLAAKPVIYLYPETETEVSVKLTLDGKLTCTYPAYKDGWTVTAAPDGTLTGENGQSYSYLYWEGETHAAWDMSQGFCVKGEDTAAFLEQALAQLGLNRREANEFIVYWLPLMEQNPYNIVAFQTEVYQDTAKLLIDPAPDTLIRVFMAWQASDSFVWLPAQTLTAPERTGFTVIEWGGTQLR